jgi:hypothetical protein
MAKQLGEIWSEPTPSQLLSCHSPAPFPLRHVPGEVPPALCYVGAPVCMHVCMRACVVGGGRGEKERQVGGDRKCGMGRGRKVYVFDCRSLNFPYGRTCTSEVLAKLSGGKHLITAAFKTQHTCWLQAQHTVTHTIPSHND